MNARMRYANILLAGIFSLLVTLHSPAWAVEHEDCIRQARKYERKGFDRIESLGKKCDCTYADEKAAVLLEKAMALYVCAAEKGSSDAALQASVISSTGFVKPINIGKERELLRQALSAGHAKAGLWLYGTYCPPGKPCLDPKQAEEALLEAAQLPGGRALVAFSLGGSLSGGEFGYVDIERAMSCFRFAKSNANSTVKKLISRFEREHAEITQKQDLKPCFPKEE